MIPAQELWQAAIDTALAEATVIATEAKADPNKYIRPQVGEWCGRWISSRYNNVFHEEDRGKMDLMEQAAVSALHLATGIELGPPTIEELQAMAPGIPANSDAVFQQIGYLKGKYTAAQVSTLYNTYNEAIAAGQKDVAFGAFNNLFRFCFLEFIKLGNTMLGKMAQGPKPIPVPGPGEHLETNPFGDWVIRKDPPVVMPSDTQFLSGITVGQLRLVLRDERVRGF